MQASLYKLSHAYPAQNVDEKIRVLRAAFYSAKSRQGLGLRGLTSRGGPGTGKT